ncbi:MAG: hypothetical protein EOM25_11715 [Deltaproteobacteria bacterium]|nr:hypothetical protein [Deltaproteobacteria bacterium]
MKMTRHSWPVMIVSGQFEAKNDEGHRLRELRRELETVQDCAVIPSFRYEDAMEIFRSRCDLGALVIDWDIRAEDASEEADPEDLLEAVRARNTGIPVILLTERLALESIPTRVLARVQDCLWKTADTIEFLAGRIVTRMTEYVLGVYPRFFGELVHYAQEYKYAWHTPGHMGGEGFLHSPAGVAMHKFFGENMFRADLSISVPELGSLLDHSGVVGDAEKNSARVFGADQTYYVLNGTSNVNQIIWRSQVLRDDIAFVDRNCHKSLNYAMVITEAFPVYMVPRRNRRGIIGPCRLSEFSAATIRRKIEENDLIPADRKDDLVRMSALTNSTYDGVCYNVVTIKAELKKSVENLHFDEAWYAYARFHPLYAGHYGMADDDRNTEHPPIFCSQSTHKLLTAFSQASMLHVKNGSHVRVNHDEMNESYMMHGSTSPQYSMIASLDVATKMMDDNGPVMMDDIIRQAVHLRRKMARMNAEMRAAGDWFFDMWQPRTVLVDGKPTAFEDASVDFLATNQSAWVFRSDDPWHGFADMEDGYAMLDPIKLTFTTPGLDDDGTMAEEGIPAAVVTNYLIDHGIVCEKTDYYSFLLLNSLGTTRGKQGALLAGLLRFKELYDRNEPLELVFPALVTAGGQTYAGQGLKDHCLAIHRHFRKHRLLDLMQAAFQVIPGQAMKPAEAYHEVVRKNVEYVELGDMMGRVPAVMVVPYPPGIPVIMGGEVLDERAKPVFDYLKARQDFENLFPGYESDIHGVERVERDGKKWFRTMCVKKTGSVRS